MAASDIVGHPIPSFCRRAGRNARKGAYGRARLSGRTADASIAARKRLEIRLKFADRLQGSDAVQHQLAQNTASHLTQVGGQGRSPAHDLMIDMRSPADVVVNIDRVGADSVWWAESRVSSPRRVNRRNFGTAPSQSALAERPGLPSSASADLGGAWMRTRTPRRRPPRRYATSRQRHPALRPGRPGPDPCAARTHMRPAGLANSPRQPKRVGHLVLAGRAGRARPCVREVARGG